MPRIIAGKYKSRTLLAPKNKQTRPTADMVKEALFSILGEKVLKAKVWDVFAGSGALGLEALSRGADWVLFTEMSLSALKVIQSNLDNLKETSAAVKFCQAPQSIAKLKLSKNYFDLVFIDPPYDSNLAWPTILAIKGAGFLAEETILIWEHDKTFELEKIINSCPQIIKAQLLQTRVWGKRAVSFLKIF